MRRAKLGDVYCVKLPNGYKLYQWAYSIPQKGDYMFWETGLLPMSDAHLDFFFSLTLKGIKCLHKH